MEAVAQAEYEEASDALHDYFMPLMRAAAEARRQGDGTWEATMDALIARCPQGVTKAFMKDCMRQAHGDAKREAEEAP